MTLAEALDDGSRRDAITDDLVRLVEDEVHNKRGLSGAVLKKGYSAFKRFRPGIVRAGVQRVLPEMATAIDPHWRKAQGEDGPDRYFRDRAGPIAEDLLVVTDAIANRSTNRVLKRLYGSLRPAAHRHVAAAVPRLPAVIRGHLRGTSTDP